MASGSEVRALYRSILRLHRQKLARDMRLLGDKYVKDEFRLHKNAKPEFVRSFLKEWQAYRDHLQEQSPEGVGKELSGDAVRAMSDEQREQLLKLREETIRSESER